MKPWSAVKPVKVFLIAAFLVSVVGVINWTTLSLSLRNFDGTTFIRAPQSHGIVPIEYDITSTEENKLAIDGLGGRHSHSDVTDDPVETNDDEDTTKVTDAGEMKIILLWNSFFQWADYRFGGFGHAPFLTNQCSVSGCRLSRDRSDLQRAAAVVFHIRKIYENDLPAFRPPGQLYVFFLIESPLTTRRNLSLYRDMFNVTITYREDSDASIRGGYRPEVMSYKVKYPLAVRTRSVVWPVSRCTLKYRNQYVDELSKYIDVDILGRCGTPMEEKWNCRDECFNETIPSNYKFYLSFENAFCKDYVTEKVIRTLDTEIVPIVYGGTNYTRDTPPHSVINILDFATPKELAQYLHFLANHEEEYMKFFEWKKDYVIMYESYKRSFCKLCAIVHDPTFSKRYVDIDGWWTRDTCGCRAVGVGYECVNSTIGETTL